MCDDVQVDDPTIVENFTTVESPIDKNVTELFKKDFILKKGSIVSTNDKTLGYVKEDFLIPQNKVDTSVLINMIKGKNIESQNTEMQNEESPVEESPVEGFPVEGFPVEGLDKNKLDIILMGSAEPEGTNLEKTIDYSTDISYVFNQPITLLELAQESMKFFTFRRKDRLLKKISPYDNEEFFYGFTTSFGLYHSDFYNYDSVFNVSRLHNLPSSLYYQAGDYSDPLFSFGNIELSDCYNKKEYGAVGDLMCGYASDHEKGPRFVRWFYCGQAFYNLWLLIMFGQQYYIFKGADKKEIIDRLYDDNLPNPHLYQAYALVIYYNETIPDDYQLGNLGDLISDNLLRLITPTF